MEERKLPNATAVLVLGLLSIFTCFVVGIGLALGIVGIILANKDTKLYNENPELYTNYSNLNVGRVFSMIGTVLGAIILIFNIYLFSLGEKGMEEFRQNLIEKMKHQEQYGR